jgi:hypothetical protein
VFLAGLIIFVSGGEMMDLSNTVKPEDFLYFLIFTMLPLTFLANAWMYACLSTHFGIRYMEESRKSGRCRDVEIGEESLKTDPCQS